MPCQYCSPLCGCLLQHVAAGGAAPPGKSAAGGLLAALKKGGMLGEAVEDVEPGMFLMHRPLGEESILERVYGVHLSTLQTGAALAKQAAAVAAAQRARLLRGDGSDAESSEEDEVVATVGFRGVLPKRIPRCGLTRGCWLLLAHPPATGSHHPAWNAIPGTMQESTSSCRHVRSLAWW